MVAALIHLGVGPPSGLIDRLTDFLSPRHRETHKRRTADTAPMTGSLSTSSDAALLSCVSVCEVVKCEGEGECARGCAWVLVCVNECTHENEV